MNKFIFILLSVFTFAFNLQAQTVTHGPITGAVTHETARVFIRTNQSTPVEIQLATNTAFTAGVITASVTTDAANDSTVIASIQGLQPNTQYYVRAVISGTPSGPVSKFKSFPTPGTPGNYKIIGGSCIRTLDDADSTLFASIRDQEPNIFIQYGDWGYPDNTNTTDVYFTNPPTSWAANWGRVQQHYKNVFGSTNSSFMFRSLAIDHVWDDHDYNNDNSGGNFASAYCVPFVNCAANAPLASPITVNMPPQVRTNLVQGYVDYFPAYPLNDPMNNGIYHKYTIGNTEVFVLDVRSVRTSQHDALVRNGSSWSYDPPSGHTLLGTVQMNWLLDGLQNSTATWKVIVSSMTFNYANQKGLDECLAIGSGTVPLFTQQIQNIAPVPGLQIAPGYLGAARFSDKWAGYKAEQNQVMNFILNNNIRNVFFISGDTHNAGIDDGTYSGIPELMSGNLKVSNRGEAKEAMEFFGFNIWNMGGSGLCDNDNFDRTYGMIEVFGEDSLVLSAVNAQGMKVATGRFLKNQPYKYDPNFQPNRIPQPVDDDVIAVEDSFKVIAVLANDVDPDGDDLYVVIVPGDEPANGTVTINADNTVTYTPNPGYVGPDAFTYKACDDNGFECNCCIRANVFIDVVEKTTTNIESLTTLPEIAVYPSPASDVVTFEINYRHAFDYAILIHNLAGEILQIVPCRDKVNVDVSKYPQGTYLYSVYRQRTMVGNGKVVVSR